MSPMRVWRLKRFGGQVARHMGAGFKDKKDRHGPRCPAHSMKLCRVEWAPRIRTYKVKNNPLASLTQRPRAD